MQHYDELPTEHGDYIAALERALPPIFAGPAIDRLTGGLFTWSGIRTRKSRGTIPLDVFGPPAPSGATPIIRDRFLSWVARTAAGERSTNAPDQAA